MTLSSIKSMFAPGAYWKVEYTNSTLIQKRPVRQVHKRGTTDLVWSIGPIDKFYTRWPKASEIIAASPGRLEFRYEGHEESFIFTRLTQPEEIQSAAEHIQACAIADAAHRAEEKRKNEETAARLLAEGKKSLEDKIRNLQPVTPWELIDCLRDHQIPISPSTIGTLRKKITQVTPTGWTGRAKRAPRFSYQTQPSVLYMKLHDHLLLQDLGTEEEIRESQQPHDPELDHLFGIQPPAPIVSALDLFAA